jgi:hypothetical protein
MRAVLKASFILGMIGLCSLNIDIIRQSVDDAGGADANLCDVDVLRGGTCPAARLGGTCNGTLDQAGTGTKGSKLAQNQAGAKNCNGFFDNGGFACANSSEVLFLSRLKCTLAMSPDEPI